MDGKHLKETLQRGEWSIEYQPEFVGQTYKKKKDAENLEEAGPGPALRLVSGLALQRQRRSSCGCTGQELPRPGAPLSSAGFSSANDRRRIQSEGHPGLESP